MKKIKYLLLIVIFFFLSTNAWSISFDKDGNFDFTARIISTNSIRTADPEGYTSPAMKAGSLVQQRNFIQAIMDIKLRPLPFGWRGKFHIVAQAFYDSLYDFGPDAYIDISTLSSVLQGQQTGTLSVWFRSNSFISSGPLIAFDNTDMSSAGYLAVGDWSGSLPNSSTGYNNHYHLAMAYQNGNSYFYDDKWHNVIVVVNETGNALYVDGVSKPLDYQWGNSTTGNLRLIAAGGLYVNVLYNKTLSLTCTLYRMTTAATTIRTGSTRIAFCKATACRIIHTV